MPVARINLFPEIEKGVAYQKIHDALAKQPLFENKTWQLSPFPWLLPGKERRQLELIGEACLSFHSALETLYLRSVEDKNILRNGQLTTPWVADYLDRGKPDWLIQHARDKRLKNSFPKVIRPDLLWTDSGWILTELDTVPGGIGLTAFLSELYCGAGHPYHVLGGQGHMLTNFYESVMEEAPKGVHNPSLVILVSDEAATYRPEMVWIGDCLQRRGKRVFVRHPGDLMPLGEGLCIDREGEPVKADLIYRFFELFDLPAVPNLETILDFWAEGSVNLTPPMRPFQEEKLALALFHHPRLTPYWKESLNKRDRRILQSIIPKTWIVDPRPIPPHASLHGPEVDGRSIHDWRQLMEASQKDRNLILKISGFDESAWGARSVTLGSDSSREDWGEAIEEALASKDAYFILQTYHKPARLDHPIYKQPEKAELLEGRLRLCPYYFVKSEKTHMSGALATFCPVDKKIIHGMSDAAMLPVAFLETESHN